MGLQHRGRAEERVGSGMGAGSAAGSVCRVEAISILIDLSLLAMSPCVKEELPRVTFLGERGIRRKVTMGV